MAESDRPEPWHLRKELSIGTIISLLVLVVGSVAAFATVQERLEHKADKAQVERILQRQDEFQRNIEEIKYDVKDVLKELRK